MERARSGTVLEEFRLVQRLAVAAAVVATMTGAPADASSGQVLRLTATAYCQQGKTKSGAHTRTGIVAADPRLLPVGSVIRITSPQAHAGVYTVMDTGAAVAGHRLDIFMPDCARAKKFGKQIIRIRVLRRGWNPSAGARSTQRPQRNQHLGSL